ncbi:MAG: thiamine pyrophosphate-binding protein [Actinomycetota bacterium]
MKVFHALAEAFVAEGTSMVFTMMGDANMHWLNAVYELGVRIVDVRHEGAGLAMADGWARVRGEPGVCSTTSGPGYAQLATTMVVASRARSPLVAFCGDVAVSDDENAQVFDQRRFAEATEARFVRLSSADDAQKVVRTAFYRARLESRPIVLSAPEDIQQEEFDEQEYVASSSFFPQAPPAPNPERLRAAAEIIRASERPVLILGRGAMQAGAGEVARRLADRIGALVTTTLVAKNWLNDDDYHAGISGAYATRTALELLQETDCVIAVGASLNQYTTGLGFAYPLARYIHIDSRPHVVMGGGRAAECYIQADAKLGLEALDELLSAESVRSTGYRTREVKERLASALYDESVVELEPGTVDPRAVCHLLDNLIPPEMGLVLGSGQQVRFGTMLLQRQRPFIVAQHHFGCIGQGLTTAIGAVLATGTPAFLMEGDVGLMMHLAEFETAVRYKVPLLVVVMNDEAVGAELHKSAAIGLDSSLAEIPTPDLGQVGVSLGGRGALVRSIDALREAAAAFVEDPGPMLIDVRISREVLSIPYQRMYRDADV